VIASEKLKMHIWDMLLMCIQGRLAASHHLIQSGKKHFFTDFITLSNQYMIFVVSVRLEVTDAFYEIYDKHERTSHLYKSYLAHTGNSSFQIVVEIYNAATKELLVQCFIHAVLVDKVTRKSTALPKWFQDEYGHCTGSHVALSAATKPNTNIIASYVSDVKLPFTDADMYGHISMSSYVKYVIQNAMEGSSTGVFKGLFHEGFKYRCKTLFIEFLSESKPGSILTVSAWKMKEGKEKQKVHFDLALAEKKVCKAYVEFDDVEDTLNNNGSLATSAPKKYENSLPIIR
jgi:acyl-CoA thioesterase FadM